MSTPLTLASARTALPAPGPIVFGAVPADWGGGRVTDFDLEIWAAAATNLTSATLYGAVPKAFVLADDDVDTVDATDNELDIGSHVYQTGDGPVRLTTSGALPGGLALATDYWVIRVGSGSIALATSLANALAGTRIDITSAGSGTHTVVDTSDTKRLRWMSFGLLGPAADGAVTLTASVGYVERVKHRPKVLAYGVAATLSAAEAVTVEAHPVPTNGA